MACYLNFHDGDMVVVADLDVPVRHVRSLE